MGLFDRFKKPKWKHEDFNVREEAIKELDDQKILVQIAKTDDNKYLRVNAAKKIDDENVLIDIAKNDPDNWVRRQIIKYKITNQDALIYIAKTDEGYGVSGEAVKKIEDQSALIDLAKNYSSIDAVKKIEDQTVLIDFAKNHPKPFFRRDAVEKIEDESVLIDIAKNDSDERVREAAVKKISDEDVLKEIIFKDSSKDVQEYALLNDNLKDEKFLKDVATQKLNISNKHNHSVRMAAINNPNLTDVDCLVECYQYFYASNFGETIKNKIKRIDSSIDVENYNKKPKVANKNQEEYNKYNYAYEVQQAFRSGKVTQAQNLIGKWGKDFPEDANYYYAKIVLDLHYLNNPQNKSIDYYFDLSEKAKQLKPYDYNLSEPLKVDAASLLLKFS